jgi:long-chain acyl-CoA synthetase
MKDNIGARTDFVRTIPALLSRRVALTPDAEAFRHSVGDRWESLTWRAVEARVGNVARALRALGLKDEERCAILASTRIEWILADLGILCAGGATTTIYPSSTADDCAYVLADAACAFAFVEDESQLAKLRVHRDRLPGLRKVVVIDGPLREDPWVIEFSRLEALGRAEGELSPGKFEEVAKAVRPESLATLVYTSGTTGRPKGVELLHEGWVRQAEAVERAGILDHPDPLQYFWLPLSHVFGKMIGTAQMQIGFPTVVDGRIERLVENLAVIRPTFVAAVPRIFEKVHNRIVQQAHEGGALKRTVFRWALAAGRARVAAEQRGGRPGPLLAARCALADRLVFRKIRALFGGRLQFFVSGSAPLSREVAELFFAAGLPILEGYGLTESAAATHANLPTRPRMGTVGPALPGVEVRLAPDGEILMRAPWIMRGYHQRPDATAEALAGGWLHTGDVGTIDADGMLTITDRKKDLIKTSGGKYVAPQEIEGHLKAASPLVSQVLVHGDRRNYVSALITLDPQAAASWARSRGIEATSAALVTDPQVAVEVRRAVAAVNAALPRFAAVKRFTVLPVEFSEAAGEVTPSQKLKRKVIEERHRAALDAMYPEPSAR